MTTEERLAKLEQELDALRTELAKTVQTKCLEIMDENAKPRARLLLGNDGPELILIDANAKPRIRIFIGKTNIPAVVLADGNGMNRTVMMVNKDGPTLAMLNEKGKLRANLFALEDVGAGIGLCDTNGRDRAGFSVSSTRIELTMRAEEGIGHAFMAVGKDGPVIAVRDQLNDRTAVMYADENLAGLKLVHDGTTRAGIHFTETTSILGLADEKGNLRASMFVGEEGTKLNLRNESGETIWGGGTAT